MNDQLSIEQRFASDEGQVRSKADEPPSLGENCLAPA